MSSYKRIAEIFTLDVARSSGVDDYLPGPVPFVTSSELNNGVVAYVTPDVWDKVFEGPALCISGLGNATVQPSKFLPKGNGGDSLTVAIPTADMSVSQLVAVAASFNSLHKWRFSYGRKCSKGRLIALELPIELPPVPATWESEMSRAKVIAERVSVLRDTPAATPWQPGAGGAAHP